MIIDRINPQNIQLREDKDCLSPSGIQDKIYNCLETTELESFIKQTNKNK